MNPKLLGMKNKKKAILLFLFQKYDQFWRISLDNFIKHIPFISVELTFNEIDDLKDVISKFMNDFTRYYTDCFWCWCGKNFSGIIIFNSLLPLFSREQSRECISIEKWNWATSKCGKKCWKLHCLAVSFFCCNVCCLSCCLYSLHYYIRASALWVDRVGNKFQFIKF